MATVYCNGYQTSCALQGETMVLTKNLETGEKKHIKIPLIEVETLVIVGNASFSTPLLHQCCRRGISVHLLSSQGEWGGTFYPQGDNYAQRRVGQYEKFLSQEETLRFAAETVKLKLENSRRVLQRLKQRRKEHASKEYQKIMGVLRGLAQSARKSQDLNTLRGYEGYGGALYFQEFCKAFPEHYGFSKRTRRPPKDPINALLSFGYTMVTKEVVGALRVAGLDPCLGFLHEFRYGRPSLALDLLEPLRAPLCDSLALHLVNHKIIHQEDHFEEVSKKNSPGVYLNDLGRRLFFEEYEKTVCRQSSFSDGPRNWRDTVRHMVAQTVRFVEEGALPRLYKMP